MMVCTAPSAIGLAMMLLWSGSLTTPSDVSAALIGDAPVEDDRDRVSDTISRYTIIVLRSIVLRNWCLRNFFFGDRGACQLLPSLLPASLVESSVLRVDMVN
jgi:hypothetical protein